MCYGVYFAAKKLKPYFQEHPITMVCTAPLAEIIGSRDASGRVAKWAIELAPYTIYYKPRAAIKSQALADFLVDWAETQYLPPAPDSTHWRMHFDGSKMRTGFGAGVVLTSPKGDKLKYVLQIHFAASNNVAEYEALIHGLRLAKELGIRRILCYGDSDLVVQQSSGDWDAKDANMASYRFLVQQLSRYFEGCEFLHVPRNDNNQADTLARIGSTRQAIPSGVALQCLLKPSIKPSPESDSIFVPTPPEEAGSGPRAQANSTRPVADDLKSAAVAASPGTSELGPGTAAAREKTPELGPGTAPVGPRTSLIQQAVADSSPPPPSPAALIQVAVLAVEEITTPLWAQPILQFLVNKELPSDETLARQIQRRAAAYTIINRELVRRSVTGVYQRCVEPEQGQAILRDIHQGECGHHAASRALVAKAFRHGFFWPTALEEAKELVQKCKGCQKFHSKPHQPASALKTIPVAWPFAVWGLDMVGPFKTARGGLTHLLVAVDKFTKWIEVKPIKKLNGPTVVTFMLDITIRYGIPHSIITDNGTNFAKGALARFCATQGIRLDLASVAHPQSNGQVERANGLIVSGIKPRLVEPLERLAGCWLDELPAVLWSLRTTPNKSTGFTPFSSFTVPKPSSQQI